MGTYLIRDLVNRLFKKKQQVSDPRDIMLDSLEKLDPSLFTDVFNSEMRLEMIDVVYPHIDLYILNIRKICRYMENNKLLNNSECDVRPLEVSVSDFFTDTKGNYTDPVSTLTELIEAFKRYLKLLKGVNNEVNQRNDILTGHIQKNVQTFINHLEEFSSSH